MTLLVPSTATGPKDGATFPREGGSDKPTALHHFPGTRERLKARLSAGDGTDPSKSDKSPSFLWQFLVYEALLSPL